MERQLMATDRSSSPALSDQLATLQSEDPRRYALLKRHIDELEKLLEDADRNYASAKQLHSRWEDPPFQPQITGQLLSTAATLEIIHVHTHRSNRNRYDLTAYDQIRLERLATLLHTSHD